MVVVHSIVARLYRSLRKEPSLLGCLPEMQMEASFDDSFQSRPSLGCPHVGMAGVFDSKGNVKCDDVVECSQ